jgi:GT2 family glycosyltransferase
MPKAYIILVNWNGWRDTIECLESVFRLRYPSFRVLVCDNGSTDGSVERIEEWARGHTAATTSNRDLAYLTEPPAPKPISLLRIPVGRKAGDVDLSLARLILICNGANLGFGGGNNPGLRCALAQSDCDFVWLLNNDTVVDPDSLSALVERMQQRPDAGICGSTLLYYDRPNVVQALGGSIYNSWTARGGHIGLGENLDAPRNSDAVERRMQYVMGASMLICRRFLEEVGLIDESYFLYFDELDWAMRARGKFTLAYAPRSIVFHKEGSAIGTSTNRAKRSPYSDYYSARSRMLFTMRYFPIATPLVFTALLVGTLLRISTGNKAGAAAVFRALRDAFRPLRAA